MNNQPPTQHSGTVQAPASIDSLPLEIFFMIAQNFGIEPDVATRDLSVQRNLCRLSLVSWRLCEDAALTLYEVIEISSLRRLDLFLRTVESRPQRGCCVRKLSVKLRLCFVSGRRRLEVCDQLYRLLNATKCLKLLSLDLQECNSCFQISSPGDIAAGGPSGKTQPLDRISPITCTPPGSSAWL